MPSAAAWEKIEDLIPHIPTFKDVAPDLVARLHEAEQLVPVLEIASSFDFAAEELKYLESIPMGVQEAIRAAVCHAIDYDVKLSLQYELGYAFAVTISSWSDDRVLNVRVVGPNVSYFDLSGPLAADTPRA